MSYKTPRPARYPLLVKRSPAGLGLFAGQAIPRGAFVIEYAGPLLKDAATERRGGRYLFAIDANFTIDGSARTNIARYINHSCRPNCEVEIDGRRLFIYAKRRIRPGEEITYHYGREYFSAFIKPHGCRCQYHHARP